MRNNIFQVLTIFLCIGVLTSFCSAQRPAIFDEIRNEMLRPNNDKLGRPLPVACTWSTKGRLSALKIIDMIYQGHYVIPSFPLYYRGLLGKKDIKSQRRLFEHQKEVFMKMKELNLPLVFISPQWEFLLSSQKYFELPDDENPNVIKVGGKKQRKVSPFGPVHLWKEVGQLWTDTNIMRMCQFWYPDPPRVIFLSNNEHSKLTWYRLEESARYMKKYPEKKSRTFKRKLMGDAWIERYRALQAGMREGLISASWQKNSIFIGYEAFPPAYFGRWPGWDYCMLYIPGRFSPYPLMWDGSSSSYYTNDFDSSTDFKAKSPQIEFMNLVFLKRKALEMNPNFWFEFSVWDGYENEQREKEHISKRSYYRKLGQEYTPQRYEGYVQFGMWLIRPRAVREYRSVSSPAEKAVPYFMAILQAVDRVHKNPLLKDFWRRGVLVPNRAHKHPYMKTIPKPFQNEDRWFLLDADVNPQKYPWKWETVIKVFSLALVLGDAPKRQWMIYAHSPVQEQKNVKVTIPDYKDITITSPVAGAFYLVDEQTGSVDRIE